MGQPPEPLDIPRAEEQKQLATVEGEKPPEKKAPGRLRLEKSTLLLPQFSMVMAPWSTTCPTVDEKYVVPVEWQQCLNWAFFAFIFCPFFEKQHFDALCLNRSLIHQTSFTQPKRGPVTKNSRALFAVGGSPADLKMDRAVEEDLDDRCGACVVSSLTGNFGSLRLPHYQRQCHCE